MRHGAARGISVGGVVAGSQQPGGTVLLGLTVWIYQAIIEDFSLLAKGFGRACVTLMRRVISRVSEVSS
jgi:hypothetical protein